MDDSGERGRPWKGAPDYLPCSLCGVMRPPHKLANDTGSCNDVVEGGWQCVAPRPRAKKKQGQG